MATLHCTDCSWSLCKEDENWEMIQATKLQSQLQYHTLLIVLSRHHSDMRRQQMRHERNKLRCTDRGWAAALDIQNTLCLVWCCGFVASSTTTLFGELGIRSQGLQQATKAASEAADNSSQLLWLRRKASSWFPKHANLFNWNKISATGYRTVMAGQVCTRAVFSVRRIPV